MNRSGLERVGTGEDRPRGVPRFLSCLIKGPLGCLFFAFGAAVVMVLLLPPALGRVLDRTLERWFEERHAGTLELSDAWLGSLYGPQRIERLSLRDPSGDEVLRGELRAPSLAELFDDRSRFGPIVLRIDVLRLVEAADGTTNLERALAELPRELEERGSEGGLSTDVPFQFELEIVVARLRTSSANGKDADLSGLNFRGRLEWGPEATHLALEGGADPASTDALHARIELGRPEFGPRRPWTRALVLWNAPTVLARTLCAPARPLAVLAGERTDRLSWSKDGPDVAFLFEDEGARFELLGAEQDGIVSGPKGSVLTATLPCANTPGQALLASLLPLVAALECADPTASHELRLTDYRWPLDGDWSALSGELELGLAPSRGTLVSGLSGEPAFFESLPDVPRSSVREGRLAYAQFELPLAQGWLRIDGTLELESGRGDFLLTGEREGNAIGPVRLVGPRDALAPAAPEPPPLPVVPEGGLPTPPGQD